MKTKELAPIEKNYLEYAKALSGNSSLLFKEQALKSLESLGLPSKKDENWIYTNLQKYLPETLTEPSTPKASENLLEKHGLDQSGHVHFQGHNLVGSSLPSGFSFVQANQDDLTWLQSTLKQDGLSGLNLLAQNKIIKIAVKKNTLEEKPFILNFQALNLEHTASQPLIMIEIEQGAQCCFLEFHQGQETSQFSSAQVFLRLEAQANVEHIGLFLGQNSPQLITKRQVKLARDANYQQVDLNLGPKLGRYESYVDLNETGANAQLYGLYALQSEQHADTFVQIHHRAAHTTSDQLFKGILSDSSRGIFTGKVTVHRDAQQVDSAQLNKNLLLGEKAHADTRPQLEVYADDVKCAHGSTVGQIDQDEVFYLQSRGLDKERALLVLCHAFGAEVLEKVKNSQLKNFLHQIFEKEYESNHFQKGQLS